MDGFWKAWMTAWCWATVALGLIFVGAAFPATDGLARLYYDLVDGPRVVQDLYADPAMRFTQAVLGAVLIGWAVTIFGLVGAAREAGAQAWRTLTAAMAVWFVADSALSAASGFPLNAIPNTLFFATYAAPVLASGVLRGAPRTARA